MQKDDYEHIKKEFNTLSRAVAMHRNKIDAKVYQEAISDCIGVVERYWNYCRCINYRMIPNKNPEIYHHNSEVYGDELKSFTYKIGLYGGDPNCEHEVYAQCSGGVKCIKCGAWYCA